ncbi:ABC transporter substrate-binding protein [Nakamurella sp. A5-74]|uniref:ABC transporter substrate-binding protein n=1 Tax=Nakamurella sp. A5-74 TaxID=3158264 RepID=A0AAU8DTN1_9ACTN
MRASRAWVVGGVVAMVAAAALVAGVAAGPVVDGVARSAVAVSSGGSATPPVTASTGAAQRPAPSPSPALDESQLLRIGNPALYADETSPTTAGAGPTGLAWRQVFRTLTRYESGSLELRPDLATSWSMVSGGRTWMFHLAPGRTFQDGTPVDASAICANIDAWAEQGDHLGWDWYLSGNDYLGCDAVEQTVTVRFEEGVANLPHLFSEVSFSIVAPDSIGTDDPVGSGPYRYAGVQDGTIRLTAVDPGAAGPDVIEMVETSTVSAAVSDLRAGRLDVVVGAAGDEMGGDTGVRRIVAAEDTMTTVNLLAGGQRLRDPKVRRALVAALDPTALSDLMGARPSLTLAPGVLGLGAYDHPGGGAAAARKLLKGSKVEPLVIGVGDTGEVDLEQARVVQRQFDRVGVSASISSAADPDEFYEKLRAGRYDVTVETFYADNLDPAEYVSGFDPRGAYRSLLPVADRSEVEEMSDRTFAAGDPRSRRAGATVMLEKLVDTSVMVPIAGAPRADWVAARVRSWPTGPFGIVDLAQVRLK